MRAEGIAVPTSSTIGYVDALTAVGIESESGVYWSGRACLITRPEDTDTYDAVFERFWFATGAGELTSSLTEEFTLAMDSDDGEDGADGERDDTQLDAPPPIELRFSSAEILRQKDFAEWTDAELAESQRLMRQLRFVGSPRRSLRPSPQHLALAHDSTFAAPCDQLLQPMEKRSVSIFAAGRRSLVDSSCCSM